MNKIYTIIFVLIFPFSGLQAQSRLAYHDLLRSKGQSQIYYEHNFYPSSDSLTTFVVNFRIENDFMVFNRVDDNTFRADIKASLEVFDRDNKNQIVRTDFWSDSKVVTNYMQTSSRSEFLAGHIETELPKGNYYYILKFQGANQSKELNSKRTFFSIQPEQATWFYLFDSGTTDSLQLINYGGNSIYGKDYLLGITTRRQADAVLDLEVIQLDISGKDTTEVQTVFKKSLQAGMFSESQAWIPKTGSAIQVVKDLQAKQYQSILLSIPNSSFINAPYRLKVSYQGKTVAVKDYQSYWYDMPLSLLNVDVAIAMLGIIMPEKQVAKDFKGSQNERIKKFNAFWKAKDPTPETEFNELMFEFYTRIDKAFKDFSTPKGAGFDTDMGKIYIVYGEPLKKERSFPANGDVIETWIYAKKNFSFKASSGFGDFELIK